MEIFAISRFAIIMTFDENQNIQSTVYIPTKFQKYSAQKDSIGMQMIALK